MAIVCNIVVVEIHDNITALYSKHKLIYLSCSPLQSAVLCIIIIIGADVRGENRNRWPQPGRVSTRVLYGRLLLTRRDTRTTACNNNNNNNIYSRGYYIPRAEHGSGRVL